MGVKKLDTWEEVIKKLDSCKELYCGDGFGCKNNKTFLKFSLEDLKKIANSNKNPSKFDYRERTGIDTFLKLLDNKRIVEEILNG